MPYDLIKFSSKYLFLSVKQKKLNIDISSNFKTIYSFAFVTVFYSLRLLFKIFKTTGQIISIQKKIVRWPLLEEGNSQNEISNRLNVTQSVISKMILRNGYQ